MRRYAYTIIVMTIFSIGFSASDEEKSKEQSVDEVKSLNVVDKKESSFEETNIILSPKEKEIADAGYNAGSIVGMMGGSIEGLSDMIKAANYLDAMNNKSGETIRRIAADQYDTEYQAPSNAQEEKLKKIYVDNYIRGMNKAIKAFK